MVQEAAGGVSMITTFVSCVFLAFVLLWIGPVFEQLPNVSMHSQCNNI